MGESLKADQKSKDGLFVALTFRIFLSESIGEHQIFQDCIKQNVGGKEGDAFGHTKI